MPAVFADVFYDALFVIDYRPVFYITIAAIFGSAMMTAARRRMLSRWQTAP
jgi:hypothetical protein